MAYFNHAEATRIREAEECYEKLKKDIGASLKRSTPRFLPDLEEATGEVTDAENAQVLKEYFRALSHFERQERKLKESEEQLEKYRRFFGILSSLLPRQSSIHDIIG